MKRRSAPQLHRLNLLPDLREVVARLPGSPLRRALPAPRRAMPVDMARRVWEPGASLLFAEEPAPAPVPAEVVAPVARPRVRLCYGFPSAILLAGGIGLLAWVYALLVPRPLNYFLFWGAWGLCLAAIFLYALRKTARAQHHLIALAAYGAVTWLPQYLRSPTQALFADELYHLQVLHQIA